MIHSRSKFKDPISVLDSFTGEHAENTRCFSPRLLCKNTISVTGWFENSEMVFLFWIKLKFQIYVANRKTKQTVFWKP